MKQHNFIRAIPKTNVKLFVPSDLGYRVDEMMATIPVLKAKAEVEKASKDAHIPTTVVLPGNLAESTFDSLYVSQLDLLNSKANLDNPKSSWDRRWRQSNCLYRRQRTPENECLVSLYLYRILAGIRI
jgi:hypothetical protein